jgi:hypothetical protein
MTLVELIVEKCYNKKNLTLKLVNQNAPDNYAGTLADICHLANVTSKHKCQAFVTFNSLFKSAIMLTFNGEELIKAAAFGEVTPSWAAMEEIIKNYDGAMLSFDEDEGKMYNCDYDLQVRA